MKTNPNESAFAMVDSVSGAHQCGLTKREYFAAMAMQGLVSTEFILAPGITIGMIAVDMADDLIDSLNREKKDD